MSHVPHKCANRVGPVSYLGDGVYGARDLYLAQAWIWTSNGISHSEPIAIDAATLGSLRTLMGASQG